MMRFIPAVLVIWSAVAVLFAQEAAVNSITPETDVSVALILTVAALVLTVIGQWVASARAFAALQQCVEDHQKLPHLSQSDIEAKISFYVSKELCSERHGDLDRRLDRIERSIEELNGLIRQFMQMRIGGQMGDE